MTSETIYFLAIILLLIIQVIIVLNYSRPAVLIRKYSKNYIKRCEERSQKVEKVNSSLVNTGNIADAKEEMYPMKPVRPEIGRKYMESYATATNDDQTKGIALEIETVSFLYNYLLNNPRENLALGFARYDKEYIFPLEDPDLTGNPGRNKRFTIMIGICEKGRQEVRPFPGTGFLDSGFYDDWNQQWP
jgi:hypothetical protein